MIQNALILLQNVMFTTKWDTYCKNWHYKGHSHTSTDRERKNFAFERAFSGWRINKKLIA